MTPPALADLADQVPEYQPGDLARCVLAEFRSLNLPQRNGKPCPGASGADVGAVLQPVTAAEQCEETS